MQVAEAPKGLTIPGASMLVLAKSVDEPGNRKLAERTYSVPWTVELAESVTYNHFAYSCG